MWIVIFLKLKLSITFKQKWKQENYIDCNIKWSRTIILIPSHLSVIMATKLNTCQNWLATVLQWIAFEVSVTMKSLQLNVLVNVKGIQSAFSLWNLFSANVRIYTLGRPVQAWVFLSSQGSIHQACSSSHICRRFL